MSALRQRGCTVDEVKHSVSSRKVRLRVTLRARVSRDASDPHGHDDVAVLVVLAVGGAELAGGLGVFEFESYVAGADCFQEVEDVVGVEADGQGVALVAGFDASLPIRRFRSRRRKA